MTEELTPLKGKKHGNCNITRCQKPNSAVWYNHGTSKWYCEECAKWLNEDRFNKADAMSMFGHDLCTHMDDENSPQDHKVLIVGDNHTGSLLTQKMLEQSGEPVIVHGGGGCGKSTFVAIDPMVKYIVPTWDYDPTPFFEKENFFASKIVQNGKRKKKRK